MIDIEIKDRILEPAILEVLHLPAEDRINII